LLDSIRVCYAGIEHRDAHTGTSIREVVGEHRVGERESMIREAHEYRFISRCVGPEGTHTGQEVDFGPVQARGDAREGD
jgi:hypothetical protein